MEYAQYVPIWEKKAWDEGVATGKKQGMEEGIEKGIEKEKINTAIRLIQKRIDINFIASVTDLPVGTIERLALESPITQTTH